MTWIWRALPLLLLTLIMPPAVATPGAAAEPGPFCIVEQWTDGDSCQFRAPAGMILFQGTATDRDGWPEAEVAVQVRLPNSSIPLRSCFDRESPVAHCQDSLDTQAPIGATVTYVCQAFGSGGPSFQCGDPLRLPRLAA